MTSLSDIQAATGATLFEGEGAEFVAPGPFQLQVSAIQPYKESLNRTAPRMYEVFCELRIFQELGSQTDMIRTVKETLEILRPYTDVLNDWSVDIFAGDDNFESIISFSYIGDLE